MRTGLPDLIRERVSEVRISNTEGEFVGRIALDDNACPPRSTLQPGNGLILWIYYVTS